jgi:hypothetical protein
LATGFGCGVLAAAGVAGAEAAGGETALGAGWLPVAGAVAETGAPAAVSPEAWPVGKTPVIAAMPTADRAMTEMAATAISG